MNMWIIENQNYYIICIKPLFHVAACRATHGRRFVALLAAKFGVPIKLSVHHASRNYVCKGFLPH